MANTGLANSSNKIWNVTNISNQQISLGDIPGFPTLNPGQTLDLLRYSTDDIISTSVDLPRGIALGKLVFVKVYQDEDTIDGGSSSSGSTPTGPAGGSLSGTYPNPVIASGAITSGMLAPGSITSSSLANNSVTSAHILDGTIVAADIANATITGAKIAPATILTGNIATGAVTTTNILDGTILNADIANGTITGAKLAAGTVALGNLAANSVDASKIVDLSVGTAELANGSVTLIKMAADSVDSSKIVNGSVTGTDIAASTITDANIVPGTITGAKIATGTITSGNILNGTIIGADIAPSTITGSNIVNGSIAGSQIANTPSGNLSATTVQGALSELDSEISALATSNTGKADKTITITGTGALTGGGDLSANRTLDIAVVAGLTASTYGSATQVAQIEVNTKGQVISAGNVTVTPAFSSITGKPTTLSGYGITDAQTSSLTNGNVLIGNASNIATPVAVSGDVTITNAGVTSIGAGKVTNTMLVSGPINTVKGSVNGVQQIDMNSAQLQTMLGLGTAAYIDTGTAEGELPLLIAGGVFPASTIPGIFINNVYTGLAANRTTQTIANGGASDASVGDVFKQTDGAMNTYMLQTEPGSTSGNWILISSATTPFSSITGLPTTIAGYGITDAMELVPTAANGHFAIFDSNGQVVDGGTTTSMVVLNDLSSATNTMTSTVNGVSDTASIVNSNALSLGSNAVTSTVNGVASNALSLNTVSLTGDVIGTVGATVLSNSGVTAGAYGSSSQIPVVTVDAKGRVTSVSTAPAPTGTTNLSYTVSPTDGVVASDTGTDATIPLVDTVNAGLMSPADKVKLNGTPSSFAPVATSGDYNDLINTPPSVTGVTNLAYTPAVSNGIVTSDTGTDATIPLADATNAGLFSAAEKTKLATYPAVYAATPTNLSYLASPSDGIIQSDTGTDATIPLVDTTNAGLMDPNDKLKLDNYPPTTDMLPKTNIYSQYGMTGSVDPTSVDGVDGDYLIYGNYFPDIGNTSIALYRKTLGTWGAVGLIGNTQFMVGATPTTDGVGGIIPGPSAGGDIKVLRGDGIWETILGLKAAAYTASATDGKIQITGGVKTSTSVFEATVPLANSTNAGLMSPAGFTSLSGLSQPLNQIVYGTGTGVTSFSQFTYDSTTSTVGIGGNAPGITLNGSSDSTIITQLSGSPNGHVLRIENNHGVVITGDSLLINASTNLASIDGGATTKIVGTITVETDGVGALTPNLLISNGTTWNRIGGGGSTPSYKANIGDGATTAIVVTHSLNTLDVMVQLFKNSDGASYIPDVTARTVNSVTITFASAPAAAEFRVLVLAI